ncbi:uncharacterized protein [Cherax quadricarinatus]|uniref:uncharacterized protein n=1 Tax=Cherax quadricarinatus TaxID=27406 RepID=UPI00387E932C
MILFAVFLSLVLTSTSSGEASCGQSTRGRRVFYDLPSENNFGLWYKMEMTYTQVHIRYSVDLWYQATAFEVWPVWSNTEEYRGITSADLRTERRGITSFRSVTITGNGTMEWILCKRIDSCPAIPAGSTTRNSSTAVTVLVMLLILLVVVMVICTAYIIHLRKIISQIIVSKFLSNNVASDGNVYYNPSSLRGAAPVSFTGENIYDEWAEIPPAASASPHKDNVNNVTTNTSGQQDITNGRFSPHNSENDIYEVITDMEEQLK